MRRSRRRSIRCCELGFEQPPLRPPRRRRADAPVTPLLLPFPSSALGLLPPSPPPKFFPSVSIRSTPPERRLQATWCHATPLSSRGRHPETR
ncbi:hypothetical protein ACQJBY_027848 [Aegilops geniculata]